MSRLDLFCSVDDFWQQFSPTYQAYLLSDGKRHRQRAKTLAPSEIMTILILLCQLHTAIFLSPGNVDDRRPLSIDLVTKLRKNMTNRLMDLSDKVLLRQRAIIETINDQLKNIVHIEHTRHRSPTNFLINLVCGLIVYCHQARKPSLHLQWHLIEAAG